MRGWVRVRVKLAVTDCLAWVTLTLTQILTLTLTLTQTLALACLGLLGQPLLGLGLKLG